jgi:hypothetical protein
MTRTARRGPLMQTTVNTQQIKFTVSPPDTSLCRYIQSGTWRHCHVTRVVTSLTIIYFFFEVTCSRDYYFSAWNSSLTKAGGSRPPRPTPRIHFSARSGAYSVNISLLKLSVDTYQKQRRDKVQLHIGNRYDNVKRRKIVLRCSDIYGATPIFRYYSLRILLF